MTITTPPPSATSSARLEAVLAAADSAARTWMRTAPTIRARVLRSVADRLDDDADRLVSTAAEETHLTAQRLRSELVRTTFQLRFFADTIAEGRYLDARVDHADPSWGMGPRPDIRRVHEPVGPVLVFAASNFPFAFSVAGGDTASALAAGCPVIVKAHSGHPRLSELTGELVANEIRRSVGIDGIVAVITGTDAGRVALADPRIKAASFTGSIPGGRALFDIANGRPDPIPFFGELGSVNPTFVTASAAAQRPGSIAAEFVGSFTLGAGQFCTKPGILLVPAESGIADSLAGTALPAPARLLNDRIQTGYVDALDDLAAHAAVTPLVLGDGARTDPPAPTLLRTTIAELLADPEHLVAEVFGPTALVVEYDDERQLLDVADVIGGQLTATVHGNDTDVIAPELIRRLAGKAGRVLWNQWPTGVTVSDAQQHGGPYPATTAPGSTSVGSAAINRFLRPVAYQGLPDHLLPAALQDANPLGIPRRVDGHGPV
ncbi:MAG: aldehyde dehydrogenase (NADP(+)) [Actinobacteria bacterium]|nr:aldehyde dehydrogenase (NADP(+)) [Actinomycetota bacterium]